MKLKQVLAGLIFLCVTMVFGAGTVLAEVKIGVFNVPKVVSLSKVGKDADARFTARYKELQTKYQPDNDAIIKLQESITKKRSVWSKEQISEKENELERKKIDLNRKVEDAEMELKQLREKEMKPIIQALGKVVKEYGKKNKFSLIIDARAGIVYLDETVDISSALAKELDAALK